MLAVARSLPKILTKSALGFRRLVGNLVPQRACRWLDLVGLKFSTAINHYTALNLTKLDVLDTFETIKIAIAYVHPETGKELPSFPADLDLLSKVKIVYHEMPGWNKPITVAKTFYDLPKAARDYVVSTSHYRIMRG